MTKAESSALAGKSSGHKGARRASDLAPKGRLTRRRFIEALLALLDEQPLRQIAVLDIAGRAETSPATFYLYFSNVRAIALAASVELSQSTPALFRILEREWSLENAYDNALALVREYVALWSRHRGLLHARNQAADEGDIAFMQARSAALRPMISLMAGKIAGIADSGVPDNATIARANLLVMMLERVGSVSPERRYNRRANYRDIENAAALLVAQTLMARFSGPMKGETPEGDQ